MLPEPLTRSAPDNEDDAPVILDDDARAQLAMLAAAMKALAAHAQAQQLTSRRPEAWPVLVMAAQSVVAELGWPAGG